MYLEELRRRFRSRLLPLVLEARLTYSPADLEAFLPEALNDLLAESADWKLRQEPLPALESPLPFPVAALEPGEPVPPSR